MLRGRLSLMSIFLSLLWINSWLAWIILSKRATNLQPMLSSWQNYFSICEVWEMQVEAISWNCGKVACCFLERHNFSKLHLVSFDKASVSSCPHPPPPEDPAFLWQLVRAAVGFFNFSGKSKVYDAFARNPVFSGSEKAIPWELMKVRLISGLPYGIPFSFAIATEFVKLMCLRERKSWHDTRSRYDTTQFIEKKNNIYNTYFDWISNDEPWMQFKIMKKLCLSLSETRMLQAGKKLSIIIVSTH